MDQKNYNIISSDDYITVKLVGNCDYNSIKAFKKDISPYIENSLNHVICNCELLTGLSKDWVRELISIQSSLKGNEKCLRFILVNSDIKKDFKEKGIDSTFKISNNLREALTDCGLVTKKMLDTEFINPFLSATLHVLKVQANVNAENGKIFVKKPDDKFVGDISGVIGIVSESFNGSVIISFPAQTFLNVMSGMLGEQYTEINKEILDGAGEITNMIFGQAKIVLNEKGYGIKTALPSVVTGKGHSLSTMTKGAIVVVPFKSTAGDFFVEICISN